MAKNAKIIELEAECKLLRDAQDVVEAENVKLKAENKKFEYKIYEDAPGGHGFNRMFTDYFIKPELFQY